MSGKQIKSGFPEQPFSVGFGGEPVLLLGRSGMGKTYSASGFNVDELTYISVERKRLSFKGGFVHAYNSDNYLEVRDILRGMKTKSAFVDDAGYFLTRHFMAGHGSQKGNGVFNFFNNLAGNFWQFIQDIKELPPDKIVYFSMHEDRNEFGEITPKTIGKLLSEKVCIEGLLTIVLRAVKTPEGYFFKTQTDGFDVAKSPYQMFDSESIPNNLKMVDDAIRNFYSM